MSGGSRWVEAGDRRDGQTVRTPRLDLWSWSAAAVGSTLTCIPFVQLALLARVPLVFSPEREGPPPHALERGVALAGAAAALIPIGAPLVALLHSSPVRVPWAWAGVGLTLLATGGHVALARHLGRRGIGSAARRWTAVALSAARLPVALKLGSLAVPSATATFPPDGSLPPSVVALAGFSWLDLGLGALAATAMVTLIRSAGTLRLPAAPAFAAAEDAWWHRLEGDPALTTERHDGGFLARGELDGHRVVVDVMTTAQPTRVTVRVSLPDHPELAALQVVGRGEEDADVPLPDPILQRMVRVSGVSAEVAAELLDGLHEPLFEVLRAHEDSRVGGGCVVAVGEAVETDPAALVVDAVLQPALRLAAALAAQARRGTGSTEGR